jgi:putative spermidine/putrescine transport system permease protein
MAKRPRSSNPKRAPLAHLLYLVALIVLGLSLLVLVIYAFTPQWPWPDLWPSKFSFKRLTKLWQGDFPQVLASSLLLSFLASILAALVSLPAARALALYDFPAKKLVRLLFALPLLIPATSYFIGLESLFTRWGISNSFAGVLLGHALVILPYSVFTLENIWRQLGKGYEEQAISLGAKPIQAIKEVSLPLMAPALISCLALGFVISFGQYFLTLMLGGGRVKTLSLILVPYMQSSNRLLAAQSSLLFVLICGGLYLACQKLLLHYYRRREI